MLFKKVKPSLNIWRFLIIIWCCCLLSPAYAISLEQAKTAGLVGEQPNGYISDTDDSTSELSKLINSVNAQRRLNYQKIAKNTNTSLSTVENVAGEIAISMTKPGNYIRDAQGNWVKKP